MSDPSHLHPNDYPYSSSLSEADSLSDSDWLDISSNKDTDNDSVSSNASDHDEADFGPPSRRSSISIGSSRDGEVEAWEGFAEDSADEDSDLPATDDSDDLIGMSIHPTLPSGLRNSTISNIMQGSLLEDQLGLSTKSLTGTLGNSRISSAGGHASTAQNSMRDLKLSFPDPLTRSHDELSGSYQDASPSPPSADSTHTQPTEGHVSDKSLAVASGALQVLMSKLKSYLPVNLEIVLYGASSPLDWLVVNIILEKYITGSGLTLAKSLHLSSYGSHTIGFRGLSTDVRSFPHRVAVVDRTEGTGYTMPEEQTAVFIPSLAIIFTPFLDPVYVPYTHTAYLQVDVSPEGSRSAGDGSANDGLVQASGQHFDAHPFFVDEAPILNSQKLYDIEPSKVVRAMLDLRSTAARLALCAAVSKKDEQVKERENFHFRVGVTGSLLAIMAILFVRAYVVNTDQLPVTVIASQTLPSPTIQQPILPVLNKSSIPILPDSVAIIPSTLKDFALAVFNPPPLSSSSCSAASSPIKASSSKTVASGSKRRHCVDCDAMSWSDRLKSSKDLVLPGPSSLSSTALPKKGLSLITPELPITNALPNSLSIRLVDSLSQIINVKALTEVIRGDMREVTEAVDELMISIGKQTAAIMQESKGSSKILRERLEKRHGKAKARAREMRDELKAAGGQLGSQLISYVGEELRTRADIARGKAREMAESLMKSDAWVAHQKRVEEHRKRIDANADKRQKRRMRRNRKPASKAKGLFSTN